jgi:hypothetical protein
LGEAGPDEYVRRNNDFDTAGTFLTVQTDMRKPAARDRPIVVAIPAQARKSWAESILRPSKSMVWTFPLGVMHFLQC